MRNINTAFNANTGLNAVKSLSNSDLLTQVRCDAASERSFGLAVIHQLREIARRRLDSQLGYSSLHKFCMEELKYSSGSAWRRIKAMEALEDLPELEARIAQGDLTLASVSQVQSFCDQKEKSVEDKKAILEQVVHLSKRETERVLATLAPLPERSEKLRMLDADHSELRVTLDAKTIAELDKIRDLISHTHPRASYSELISYLARLGIKRLDPAAQVGGKLGNIPREGTGSKEATGSKDGSAHVKVRENFPPGEIALKDVLAAGSMPVTRLMPAHVTIPVPKAIPTPIRRAVWQRDGGRCGYQNSETGKVCGATALIQVDHIVPRAKGGSNELSNLRLRCRSHNLLAAIREFGAEKMERYLHD